jgi:hypothetical protein
MAVNFAKLPDLLRQPLPTSRQARRDGMQPHIHESVPCRLVLQLRTYRCNAVNRRFGANDRHCHARGFANSGCPVCPSVISVPPWTSATATKLPAV